MWEITDDMIGLAIWSVMSVTGQLADVVNPHPSDPQEIQRVQTCNQLRYSSDAQSTDLVAICNTARQQHASNCESIPSYPSYRERLERCGRMGK